MAIAAPRERVMPMTMADRESRKAPGLKTRPTGERCLLMGLSKRFYSTGAPGPDEPANSLRPSESVTVRAFAAGEPSRARNPVTVTVEPTGRSFCRQPRRYNEPG